MLTMELLKEKKTHIEANNEIMLKDQTKLKLEQKQNQSQHQNHNMI